MMHSLNERANTIDTKKYRLTNRGQAAIRSSFGEAETGPVRGQRWGVILAGGDGTRLRALTSAFLEIIRRAVPDLFEPFAAAQTSLSTSGKEAVLSNLYQSIPSINFSHEVLARLHDSLAVLRVSGVGWSDWGEPERVLATLAGLGVRIQWAASAS